MCHSRSDAGLRRRYESRKPVETSGLLDILARVPRWEPTASLDEIRAISQGIGPRSIEEIDRMLPSVGEADPRRLQLLFARVSLLNADGETARAYESLERMRTWVQQHDELADISLYIIIFLQGVVSMRRGETENCVMCRGESSCILPIAPAAVHTNPAGSRTAIRHFTEYLEQFPDDLGVRRLLNLAHMNRAAIGARIEVVTAGDTPQTVQGHVSSGSSWGPIRSSSISAWPRRRRRPCWRSAGRRAARRRSLATSTPTRRSR